MLVAAFEGWNDAADAATSAARFLRDHWAARQFADIDPETFYDFSATRPQVRLVDGLTREIVWPANELFGASLAGTEHDIIVLLGVEPGLRWRTFAGEIVEVGKELGVELFITLGALLADVPHTRPVRVTGTAADPDPGQLLRYSLDPGGPAGMAIDPDTGRLTWTPADGPANVTVTVRVADKGLPSLEDAKSFVVSVGNVAPVVSVVGDATLVQGGTLSRVGSFADPGTIRSNCSRVAGGGTGP